jgi:hypothetical protein
MLAKSAEYMRSSRENLALRPAREGDVKALIRYDRFDLIFLLLKYRKLTRLLIPIGKTDALLCSNEEGTEILVEPEIPDDKPKYQDKPDITTERIESALETSELFFQNVEKIDWFQIAFGWNGRKRNRDNPFLPSGATNVFLPPPVMALVAQFVLMQTKYAKDD